MKKIMIMAGIVTLTACGKDVSDKLFGKWQLQTVEKEGVLTHADTVYFNFEHSLFMYQIYVQQADTFIISYGYNTPVGADSILLQLENKDVLPYSDWTSDKRIYAIDRLTGKRLVLSTDGTVYTFHKF